MLYIIKKYKITILIALLIILPKLLNSYQFKKITVLTNQIGLNNKLYGGHYAVTRSLIEGLTKLGVNFNYNPQSDNEIGDVIIVLSNINALQQAIILKQEGIVKKILAGPNLVNLPSDCNRILDNIYLDICIVNSNWTYSTYLQDMPSLNGKIRIWPAGVNSDYWKPICEDKNNTKNVLVYVKFEEAKLLSKQVSNILQKYNWNPIEITYGNYDHEQFKNILSKCKFSVFLSRSESQGLALAEAWAMDIPTIPWNPGYLKTQFWEYKDISSCPYLNNKLGLDWKTLEEFENIIKNIESKLEDFSPRKWLLENMNDEACANKMLEIIKSL